MRRCLLLRFTIHLLRFAPTGAFCYSGRMTTVATLHESHAWLVIMLLSGGIQAPRAEAWTGTVFAQLTVRRAAHGARHWSL